MIGEVFFRAAFVFFLFVHNVNCLMEMNLDTSKYPLNRKMIEDALDPVLCQQQLTYLTTENPFLLGRFLDAGIRLPRGIFLGNNLDFGSFHQCLGINENIKEMSISGKYCRIQVPMNQDLLDLPGFSRGPTVKLKSSPLDKHFQNQEEIVHSNLMRNVLKRSNGTDNSTSDILHLQVAICIPKPCSTEQAINGFFNFTEEFGLEFYENLCRLPDDKPWAASDYVATIVFSTIGILTLISTCYDLYQSLHLKKGPKDINTMYSAFSVYTNTRRLLTFNSTSGSLDCLDGIRALAMIWVILGHSFFAVNETINPIEVFWWSISLKAIWITVGPLTVDTFFLLSGLLLVYTTVGKLGRMEFLKNIHMFYLHRIIRLFPILAAVILFESSLLLRVSDGPMWDRVAFHTSTCRQFWWSTLLYLQNIVNPRETCIGVTWYLAIDMQLHILSPIILFWVLTSRRAAWTALNASLLATLTASTVYIFFRNFQSGIISPNRQEEGDDFYIYYYVNILTRASPFFVGMVYGYLLHLWKIKKAYIPKALTTILLLLSLLLLLVTMYCSQIAMTLEWDNQLADNLFNSFLRAFWALGLGWIIFACVQGRAEPINWFLSLHMWKLPARISYAMYLIHYSIMVAYYASRTEPVYFTVPSILFNFCAFMFATIILSFFVTLLIDSPFSTIFKILLGSPKKSRSPKIALDESNAAKDIRNGFNNKSFEEDVERKK